MLILIALEVENLDGHLHLQQRIVSQEDGSEAALSELSFDLQEFHSDLIVEIFAEGVKQELVAVNGSHVICVHELKPTLKTK